MKRLVIALLCIAFSTTAFAHSGGLNKDGCHHNRKTGDYHCHR
ncbi:YHYH domain-containing protein [Chitiniphilus shinanonensis]